ncbi:GNAT family N-acetyltransferase [Erythrobacter insulae]|uniref:GNAT family N-acetyltransferase n=1 Tax=Erythrobacter insulae TaxID=2584124 RepID=A0A547PDU6_9SPHN|nr:GNAT family protein [Erythrobacter insulae]TRD12305.1 GNAT family N-acetyltransferase [Erythrobacter insulae]
MVEAAALTTRRFTLRPLERADAAALYPTLSDPSQCTYLSREAFASEEELWAWLADPEWPGSTWIAVDERGAVAGRFVAMPAHEERVLEIGYITCADRQRQGVASECMAALIAHLFENDARKLTAVVDCENIASARVMDTLGFTREAHFREHETTHEGLRDVWVYGRIA